ncbi:CDP-diacylglycerol--glycerol-3-phosphate 3-phosphatidyltransferase isoform X2 [Thalassophryne amazonica]|uniref:CDP-diacylglycerol--glycerol-3-phosphate 3-phosphatidyltransferase isoform X2 n=1 Tax=Thalassophryne amazonica TaxID=390379 RepID=UPI0014722978|nr:CDP-diacylglycerol--glycerol-3-phosphate 3-phosphatidyltransferase isoform X2 [Thalassophryne amazonica]
MGVQVLLFWPNVVGYLRILLLFAAWCFRQTPEVFVPLYSICTALDGVDGWLARTLDQTSRFGAWLDVVVDNLSRAMLWSLTTEWGWLVSALEWCVFVCNHGVRGHQWKSSFTDAPPVIRAVMANGFWTPLGCWVVSGLHGLPLWVFGCQRGVLSRWGLPSRIQALGTLLLAAGRLLALSAEIWCIWTHVKTLIKDESEVD